jgi:Helix-turn-helix domain
MGVLWLLNKNQELDSQHVCEKPQQQLFDVEPFVDSDTVAQFLAVKRKTILDWARAGIIPAHPFGKGKRAVWRFRISEIASHAKPARSTMGTGSPEIARLERKHG